MTLMISLKTFCSLPILHSFIKGRFYGVVDLCFPGCYGKQLFQIEVDDIRSTLSDNANLFHT